MNNIEVNDQVRFRNKRQNCTEVKFGTVISFESKDIAVVSVQQDPQKPRTIMAGSRIKVLVKDLEPVKKLFGGRAVVQANPVHRCIATMIQK